MSLRESLRLQTWCKGTTLSAKGQGGRSISAVHDMVHGNARSMETMETMETWKLWDQACKESRDSLKIATPGEECEEAESSMLVTPATPVTLHCGPPHTKLASYEASKLASCSCSFSC